MYLTVLDAVKQGRRDIASQILHCHNCENVNQSDRNGSVLYHCCCRGYGDLALLLLKNGANAQLANRFGSTPLHAAADNGFDDIVRILLIHGASANAQNHQGDTACHLAAYRGQLQIVRLFLANGYDVNVRNIQNRSAFQVAKARGHGQVADCLHLSDDQTHLAVAEFNFAEPSTTVTKCTGESFFALKERASRKLPVSYKSQVSSDCQKLLRYGNFKETSANFSNYWSLRCRSKDYSRSNRCSSEASSSLVSR